MEQTHDEHEALFLKGIEHFNACDFFEAHEVWEEIWQDIEGADKKFYQGLIQAAVALHHFGNGNTRGARKLNLSCRSYLRTYLPWHMGVDVQKLFDDMDRCFAEVMASQEEYPTAVVVPDLIPEIHLTPPPAE